MSISAIYKIFAEEVASIDFACAPGCDTCCTRSVTLTTGEGRMILDYLHDQGGELPELPRDPKPIRPSLTTNGLAEAYLAGREPVDDNTSWLFEPCFFLRDGLCSIYKVRPFACRSFGSMLNCRSTGEAVAPDWFITVTIAVKQILEEFDQGGYWGNLADVLAFLDGGINDGSPEAGRLLANKPVPGFLLLPGEQPRIKGLLAEIGKVCSLSCLDQEKLSR